MTPENTPPGTAGGLRAVAVFEAAKGAVMLLAGLGLLGLLHRDVRALALEVVRVVHLNPAHRGPHGFIAAAGAVNDRRLELLAAAAFAYTAVRAVEAWGLWRLQPWAQWFGAIAGGVYLPIEVWELVRRPTPLHAAVLFINVAIVVYLVHLRVGRHEVHVAA